MTTKKTKIARAIVLLAGGVAIGGGVFAYNQYSKYSKSYEAQLKKEISDMSKEQLEDAIKACDVALENLQKIIDSDETNPEERFQAINSYKGISNGRDEYQKRLDKIMKKQAKTINFNDAMKIR